MRTMKASFKMSRCMGKSTAEHNDRAQKGKNDNVKYAERTKDNLCYCLAPDGKMRTAEKGKHTFTLAEKKFYDDHFSEFLKAQNERHIKGGHKSRVKSMESVMNNKDTSPMEMILQVGQGRQYEDIQKIKKMVETFYSEIQQKYPKYVITDIAIHCDEKAVHAHLRGVFVGVDKYGNVAPNQTTALQEMGFIRPDVNADRDRFNNEIMTFTDTLREEWYNTIERIDPEIKIDREAREYSKKQMTTQEYNYKQQKAENEALRADNAELTKISDNQQAEIERQQKVIEQQKAENAKLEEEADITKDIVARRGIYKPIIRRLKEEAEKTNDRNNTDAMDKLLRLMELEDENQTAIKSLYDAFGGDERDGI